MDAGARAVCVVSGVLLVVGIGVTSTWELPAVTPGQLWAWGAGYVIAGVLVGLGLFSRGRES